VIIPENLSGTSLDGYQVIVLCNVSGLSDPVVARLQNYLRQGGGLLIFGGDRLQPENYNARLLQALPAMLPAQIRDQKLTAETAGEKIAKLDLDHPALRPFSDAILQDSMKSARIWGYSRIDAPGKSALISLTNGDPLLVEQKVGAGKVLFFTATADRDWTDLPVKTAYLPLIQALTNYLAGGKRGLFDPGIAVGSSKDISLPPSYVGKSLRITKPDNQVREVTASAEKDRALASFRENDVAGIYRLEMPAGGEKQTGLSQVYAVNPPFLESRLDEISQSELQARLRPIGVEVLPFEALQQGGTRTDLALPLLALLIGTLLLEGWVALRF
jgi:hypothetical protein